MNCKQIQELILTDYSDGQLKGEALIELEAHLSRCEGCRALAQEIKRSVIQPLAQAPKLELQEAMWRNIRDRIQDEKVSKALAPSPWDHVKDLLLGLRPALVVACVFLVLGTVILSNYRHPQMSTAKSPSKETYLTYVMATEKVSDNVSNSIEQYFL